MRSFLLLSLILPVMGIAQQTITFPSKDGLPITADIYESKKSDPWMLLFHQAGYSRGEYKETAEKLVKLGYNCLAVDLRSGSEVNFVKNNTFEAASNKNLRTDYIDSKPDMEAAINFAFEKSQTPVVIFGSSYSASLCLLLAKTNKNVSAAIVFSPGEYFESEHFITDQIAGLNKPIFAASSVREYPFMKALFEKTDQSALTLFKPSKGQGVHGSRALWQNNPNNNEYWLSLMLFISNLKQNY
jgi:dienelactone hydrolase